MLPAIAICSFIVILSLMLFIKFLKRNVAERQRLARAAAMARHNNTMMLHGGGVGGYGFTNQVILTNGAAYGNGNSAIMIRHPPLETGAKPFYDIPPPSYEEYDSVPTQLQARPTAPPEYNDLNILPGSIPSTNIQLLEPLSRLEQNVLPQKR